MQAHVFPMGNLANQMLQFVFMEGLRKRLPDLAVGGVNLPQWHIKCELPESPEAKRLRLYGQFVDRDLLCHLLERGWLHDFEFAGLGFRMDHYPSLDDVRPLFPRLHATPERLEDDELLINVRGAEVLGNLHPDYGPLPIGFLRQLVESTGLRPVLMGQIADDWYSESLRQAFNGCRLIPSRSALEDFDIIRSATHVAMSLSTFSWMACWLSHAQTIHMPVVGMFNPQQRPEIDLLPLDDGRYRFYEFDVRRWTASDQQIAALHATGEWPELPAAVLRERLQAASEQWRPFHSRYRRQLLVAAGLHRLGWSCRVGVS
ncbi:MAG: hypothetical protein EOP39_02340 [Rubrivivax sp.]|nr:MAG: hypothetical protein EOP39_02340 [Rubrivivax sp.]